MIYLLAFAFFIWGFSAVLELVGTWASLKHFKTTPPRLKELSEGKPFPLFPISVLKPLRGIENGIDTNIETFFRLDYPEFELLFSVADPADPACDVIRALMLKYPNVSAQLIVGHVEVGPNPKVNNMITSYENAKHDWVLISDSNVRVAPDYLKVLAAHVEPGVGMVTAFVGGRNPEGIGGHLEAVFLNTFYARWTCLLELLDRPPVVGKSMLFQRSVAKRFGGIRALARYLAEDFMAGEAMRLLNLRVVLARDPIDQHIGKISFDAFWSRHVRWGRIRKMQAPAVFLLEPLFGSIASGLLGAWAFSNCLNVAPSVFLFLHLAVWSVCDLAIMKNVEPRLSMQTPVAWFLREFLAFPLWLHIASGNTINWRGNRLKIQRGGTLRTALPTK